MLIYDSVKSKLYVHLLILKISFLAAQEDVLQLDVLVCGKCQNVYHFIEAFSEHKNSNECDMETQVFKSNTNVSYTLFMLKTAKYYVSNKN